MLLYSSLQILSSKELALRNVEKVKPLLKQFVHLLPTFGDVASQTLNFHSLIHLPDNVLHMQRTLGEYSAFTFENTIGFVKKLLKSTTKPVSQIALRVQELLDSPSEAKNRYPLICPVKKSWITYSLSRSYRRK